MAPKSFKNPIPTSVAWTARYQDLQSAGPNDDDYKSEKARALQKIRHYEGREDVRNGIVKRRNDLRKLRQENLKAQAALGNDGVSLNTSVTSSLDAAKKLDKAESEFAEFEKKRRASRYEQGWKTGKSEFFYNVDNDPDYMDGINTEKDHQSAHIAKQQANKPHFAPQRGQEAMVRQGTPW